MTILIDNYASANSLAHKLALWALPVTSSRPVDISSIPSWGQGDVEL